MRVLGIETSCDETGVAIYETERGLVAESLYSQAADHAIYGGVVPELASRDHIRKLTPLIKQTLKRANLQLNQLDGIGYTGGPGLIGALLVGAAVGRSLAWSLGIPCVMVHHMEAHLLAALLSDPSVQFPFLGLLVSGGHTLLIQANALGNYMVLGDTVDDAVGEAFDKTAKLLGLGYPGGAALACLAEQGDPQQYTFPRPMTDRPGLDFSFSGLKTFALNTWEASDQSQQAKANIASAFQIAVVETLVIKCRRAIQQTELSCLVVAGGVSANQLLRHRLHELAKKEQIQLHFPELAYCTDNGAMVAFTAHEKLQRGEYLNDLSLQVKARWPLGGDRSQENVA